MSNSDEPPAVVTARPDALTETDDSTEIQTITAQIELVIADPMSIIQIEEPAPDVQLAAIAASAGLYWKLQNPCERATIEYLCQRPYDIIRFRSLHDEVKAKVITRSPKLIYDWVRRGYLKTPVEPDGFHDAVMREILTRIKWGIFSRTIVPTVKRMREIGYDWPEFNAIERSFSAD